MISTTKSPIVTHTNNKAKPKQYRNADNIIWKRNNNYNIKSCLNCIPSAFYFWAFFERIPWYFWYFFFVLFFFGVFVILLLHFVYYLVLAHSFLPFHCCCCWRFWFGGPYRNYSHKKWFMIAFNFTRFLFNLFFFGLLELYWDVVCGAVDVAYRYRRTKKSRKPPKNRKKNEK